MCFLQPGIANWSFSFRSAGLALALVVLGGTLDAPQAQSRRDQPGEPSSAPENAEENLSLTGQTDASSVLEVYQSIAQGGIYQFTFDFRGGTRVRLPGRKSGTADSLLSSVRSSAFEVHVQGTWEMTVYQWESGRSALVGWTAPSSQVTIRQQVEGLPKGRLPNEDSLEAGLAREVLVRIAPSGKVERLLFPRNLPSLVGSFWRQWADQVVLHLPPGGESAQWQVEGQGPIGRFHDQYRLEGPREAVRERKRYASLNGDLFPGGEVEAGQDSTGSDLQVEGKSRYQVHPKRGYLGTGSGSLVVKSLVAGAEQAEVIIVRSFRFASESFEQREVSALREELLEKHGVGQLAALQEVLRPVPLAGLSETEASSKEEGERPLEPWSGLLSEIEQSVETGAFGQTSTLRDELSRHLRQHPERFEEVAERLGAPQTSASFRAVLFSALAEAGTPEAQTELAKWVGKQGDPETTRRALFSLAHVENPSDVLYDQVRHLSRDDGASPQVRREAVRMVGVLAGRRQGKPSGGEEPEELFAFLQGLASSDEPSAMRQAAIHALGNTRLPSAVEPLREVARQAGSNASVAEAVIAALEHVPGPESTGVLISLAEKYRSPAVFQHRVISALTEKYESAGEAQRERIHQHLTATLQEGKPTTVRLQVLGHYIAQLRSPESKRARKIVLRAAESNTSEEVRTRARQALETAPHVAKSDSVAKSDQEQDQVSSGTPENVSLTLLPRAGLFLSGASSFGDISGGVSSSLGGEQSVFTWGASLAFGSRDGPVNFRLTGLSTTGSLASTTGGIESTSAVPNKLLALTGDVVVRPIPRFLVQPYVIGGAGARRLTISRTSEAGTDAQWNAALQVGVGVDLRLGNTTLGAEVADYLSGFGGSDRGLQHDAFLFLTFGIPLH